MDHAVIFSTGALRISAASISLDGLRDVAQSPLNFWMPELPVLRSGHLIATAVPLLQPKKGYQGIK